MLGQDRRLGVAGALALTAVLVTGCGGGGPATRADDDTARSAQPTEEEKFQAAQFQACEIMCTLLTRCSQVSLKAHWDELSDEDKRVAESIGPDDLARHSAECAGSCQDSALSVRQVQAIRGCLNGMPAEQDPDVAQ